MSDSTHALERVRKQTERIGLHTPVRALDHDDTSLDVGTVWETVKRNKWLILGVCVLVTALAAGITLVLPKIYESTAVVSVEESRAEEGMAPMMSFAGSRDLSAEIGILENSGELARRVIAEVRLVADAAETGSFTLLTVEEGEGPRTEYELVERLQEMVSFEADSDQGLIEITAESESPAEAAHIANRYAEEYRSFSQEMARAGVVAARTFLEAQLEKRKADIKAIEDDWERFARNNAIATEGQDGQQVAQEYVELQTQRDAVQFQLEQEMRLLEVLRATFEERQPDLRETVLEEQEVQGLRTQIQAIENQIAGLRTQAEQYYINDPRLRGNESRVPELADLKRRIDGFENRKVRLTEDLVAATEAAGLTLGHGTTTLTQMGAQVQQLRTQELKVGQLEAQIEGFNQRIARYQDRITQIPSQTVQREQLERRLAQAEGFYTSIAGELQKTIIAEESELGFVKIMRSAVVPMMPVRPNFKQNIILGLLLGLGFGLGGAFLRQSMNWQIYEPDDIQEQGYSLVGVIPKMDRELRNAFQGEETVDVEGHQLSTRLFPLLNPWSPITENYRLIRTNLKHAFTAEEGGDGHGGNPTILMITSPEPGDGKTTTAVNLAITIALSGRRVLLVDADLRRPNAHKMLGVERSPGLTDILSGRGGRENIRTTMIDGLQFVSAGIPELPPTELLDTERMRSFLAISRDRFDVVIVDTPPVLAATDPLVIAPYCEAVLVVASADKTDFRGLSQVESTLNAIGVPIGGIIFNRYNAEKASATYKYGYGYDYKYDYSPTAS